MSKLITDSLFWKIQSHSISYSCKPTVSCIYSPRPDWTLLVNVRPKLDHYSLCSAVLTGLELLYMTHLCITLINYIWKYQNRTPAEAWRTFGTSPLACNSSDKKKRIKPTSCFWSQSLPLYETMTDTGVLVNKSINTVCWLPNRPVPC